jgi:hypothetical protein
MKTDTKVWTGLQSAALALIFAPEPVSTFVGIGLLVFARTMQTQQAEAAAQRKQLHNTFSDYYQYRVAMVRGASVAYSVTTTKQGQLPLVNSNISRLYDPPPKVESRRRVGVTPTRTMRQPPSTPQPAGMLKTPSIRCETRLIGQKRIKP